MKTFTDKGYRADRRYSQCRFSGFRLTVAAGLCDDAFVELCCRISENKSAAGTRVNSSAFARVHRFSFRDKVYYHKAFLLRSRWEPVKDVLKGTRAERTFRGHLLLEKNGFDTPRVVAVGKKGPINFMVAEAMADERGGGLYCREFFSTAAAGKNRKAKRDLIRSLGGTVGRLHAAGIFHGDLRLNNLGIKEREPGHWQFELIDNERTVQYRRLPVARRTKNLVQLDMSAARLTTRNDRLRFFDAYLSENPALKNRKKQWIRHILKHLERRLVKKARKTGGLI